MSVILKKENKLKEIKQQQDLPIPNESLIEHLEKLLQEAKQGDLQALIGITQYSNRETFGFYLITHSYNDLRIMLGEMNMIKAVLLEKAIDSGWSGE